MIGIGKVVVLDVQILAGEGTGKFLRDGKAVHILKIIVDVKVAGVHAAHRGVGLLWLTNVLPTCTAKNLIPIGII